jgi:antirestriction protein ArdC
MGFRKSANLSQRDHYQDITNQIVEALEAGIIPWRREWDQGACGVPMNVTTGKAYRKRCSAAILPIRPGM